MTGILIVISAFLLAIAINFIVANKAKEKTIEDLRLMGCELRLKIEVLQTEANAQNLRILQQETELNNLRGVTMDTTQQPTIPSVVVELLKKEKVRNEFVELLERAADDIMMTRPQLQELEEFIMQLKTSPKTFTAFVENVGQVSKSVIEKAKNGFLGAIAGAKNGLKK